MSEVNSLIRTEELKPPTTARCPYCVEETDFKPMSPILGQLVCADCGHRVVPNSPAFICRCFRCRALNYFRRRERVRRL